MKKVKKCNLHTYTVLEKGLVNCLGPGPCSSKWSVHVRGKEGGLLLGPSYLIPVSVAVGIRRALRHPLGRWPLLIVDEGLAINRVTCCLLKTQLIHSPYTNAYVYIHDPVYFRKNKSLCFSTACIDPLSKPIRT